MSKQSDARRLLKLIHEYGDFQYPADVETMTAAELNQTTVRARGRALQVTEQLIASPELMALIRGAAA